MPTKTTTTLLLAALLLPLGSSAASRDELLGQYALSARAASPAFSGFSAARGEKLHVTKFAGGKAETPACTSCHADSPLSAGRTPAGKSIDALAVSLTPTRYTDPAKVEKWFKRNCHDVLGRECTPLEKGDWLSYMISQ
ncbi:MAG: DUF1924 domain-containing protein [Propionivibrio sp.]|uniref:DUF1924 domain-containing protein n=1 Tax=Candidatus Propionivibrio dominans TaxID=2954373 RepID=A0A9D7FAH9_9RHOO|nr:DUF1924 domain-containing protein [Candidatus Propionivibrio dominans]MBL0168944.1 DUF1924 domain-containing protein [Propionivibrio sp.]